MREREAKLQVDDGFELPDLRGVVAGAEVGPATTQVIEDTYYDTDDLRLLRWGCTLRHRKRRGWTVKLPVARTDRVLTRDEIAFRGPAGRPPQEAETLVASYARGRPLVVIARLHKERTVQRVTSVGGELLVEVADDRTTGEATGGTLSSFRQVEAELGPEADPASLDEVVRHLLAAGARPDTDGIKLVKALGGRQPGAPDVVPVPLGRDPTAREVIQRALARSAAQLITELPVALVGDDPKGVHRARVATRRLRSDLRTLEPLLDRTIARGLRDDLKPLAAHLGTVRDTDVLLHRFETARAELDELDELDGEAAGRVLELLDRQRRAARTDLVGYIGGGAVHGLLDAVVAFAADPPTIPVADRPAADQLAGPVGNRWRRLDRAVSDLGDDPEPSALHGVRLRVKRTRYGVEAVADVFGEPARRFARSLAEVQDVLGDYTDAIVAERWLSGIVAQLDPRAAFAAGRLAQLARIAGDSARREWRAPYERAAQEVDRRWLA